MNKRMLLILIAVIALVGSYFSIFFSGYVKQPKELKYTPGSLKPLTTEVNFTGKIMDFYPYISFALVSERVQKDYLEKALDFPGVENKSIFVTLNPHGSGYLHKVLLYSNDSLKAGFRMVFRTYRNFTIDSPPTRRAIVFINETNQTIPAKVLYSKSINQTVNLTCVVEKLGEKIVRVYECYDKDLFSTNIFGIPQASFFILQPVTAVVNVTLTNITDRYVVEGTYDIFSYMAENQTVKIENISIEKGRIPLSIKLDYLPDNLSKNYTYKMVDNSTYLFTFSSLDEMRTFVKTYNVTPPNAWFRAEFTSKNYTHEISLLEKNGYDVTSVYRIAYFIPPRYVHAENRTIEVFYREPTEILVLPQENDTVVKAELQLGMKYDEVLSITAREIQ